MLVFSSHKALRAAAPQGPADAPARAVVIGNFDGVHLGHQALFRQARSLLPAGGKVIALTFWPHPARVLAPQLAPPLILSQKRRRERLAECGVDILIEEPFVPEFAALSPEAFVEDVLIGSLGARFVVVGHDFTFGKGRAGNTEILQKLLGRHGAEAFIVPAFTVKDDASGQPVVCSSTFVRRTVQAGELPRAALCLGRDVELEGTVVRGAQRGRELGVPTANLACEAGLRPAIGIYAAFAELVEPAHEAPIMPDEKGLRGGGFLLIPRKVSVRYPAAVSVGYNATFTSGDPAVSAVSIEAHLIEPNQGADPRLFSLYGKTLRLHLRARLRDELRFPSVEALVEQIHRDIHETKRLLEAQG